MADLAGSGLRIGMVAAAADAARVAFDLGERRIERGKGAELHAGHRLDRMAGRGDPDTAAGRLADVPHAAAEQVGELPDPAALAGCHDYVQAGLPLRVSVDRCWAGRSYREPDGRTAYVSSVAVWSRWTSA